MPKYNLTSKKIIKILEKESFYFVRQNGSHAVYKNPHKKLRVVVPIHSKDIPTGTAHSILKDAQITL